MVQNAVIQSIETFLGLVILAVFAYSLYRFYQFVMSIREPPDDYEERVTGVGNYPDTLDSEEAVLFDTRGRDLNWKLIMITGVSITVFSILSVILIFFSYLGIALIIYANNRRNDPDWVFTSDRVFKIRRDGTFEEFSYDNIYQLQTGTKMYERLIQAGHLKFAVGESRSLHQITAIRSPNKIARRLEKGINKEST